MLSERQKKVLSIILDNPKGIKGAVLAEKLHVTTRTVRNDIASINMTLMNSHCMIQSSKRAGYFVMKNNVSQIRECLSLMSAIDNMQIASTPVERRFYLLGQLSQRKKLSINKLAEELYVSEQTAYKDLISLIHFLKESYNFEGISLNNGTICLTCEEIELRTLFYRIIKDDIYLSNKLVNLHLYQLVKDSYDLEELNSITDYIGSYCCNHDIILADRTVFVISWMIFFTSIRIENGCFLHKNVELFYQNEALSNMLESLIEDLRYDLEKVDYILLQNYVETLGFYNNKKSMRNIESDEIVNEFTSQVQQKYKYDFKSIPTLYENFRTHLQLAVKRLLVDYQLSNPMLQDVKTKYPFAYEIAMLIVPILHEKYGLYMSEDEVSFLALYVMPFLKMQDICFRVILINSFQQSFTNLLEIWLKQEFKDHIKVVAITPFYGVKEEIEKTKADLIISDTLIDQDLGVPTLLINQLPGEKEKQKIRDYIESKAIASSGSKIFHEVFSKEKILFIEEDTTFDDVICLCAKNLKAEGIIRNEKEYMEAVISREKVYPTHIANRCFMPHPLVNEGIKSGISVAIIRKNVKVGDISGGLLFVSAQEATINKDMIYIYNLINKVAASDKLVNVLTDLNSPQEFIDYLERIIQIM